MREDELAKAEAVHKSIEGVPGGLLSRPILKTPKNQIRHPFRKKFKGETMSEIVDYAFNHPSLQDEWFEEPHHDILLKMVADGELPYRISGTPDTPMPLVRALAYAHFRGHKVPDDLVVPETSFSETQAFYAARMFLSRVRGEADSEYITSLASNFAIPNPRFPQGLPYFADQLWIVHSPPDAIRFIVVEIDGEHHFLPERKIKDDKRDDTLEALGYEVYRIAASWCRVDPWRAVYDVAKHALPNVKPPQLPGFNIRSLSKYECSLCDCLMTRWESDWIMKDPRVRYDSYFENSFVHLSCYESQML